MTISRPKSKTRSQNKATLNKTTSIHILITALEQEVMSSGENTRGQGRHNNHPTQNDAHASQGHQSSPRRPSMAIEDMLNPVIGEQSSDGGSQRFPGSRALESAQHARRPTSSSSVNGRPRTSSSASRSPGTKERRQFRPTYSDEEVYFIWYYRIDLGYDWQDITNAYNAQFSDRPREGFGGIQCKYYRYCEEFGIPKVRDRDRGAPQVLEYGMRSRTGLSYPWMRD
ncbi:hypothetical protein MMC07_004116 [Pseudocyphellaria aurata]|nr:hypothetical protein [Pseudocyphellaria aurata]